ncbi:MAG TPA: two-component regulator propeller domain-containing protein [Burkholderiaceae bacterium]
MPSLPARMAATFAFAALTITVSLFSLDSHAATSVPLRFEQLNIEQGLPQESVLALTQDRQGYMWLGTVAGLARYDGYTITVFKNQPGDVHSLSDNFVTCLYQDAQGILWIGTRGGLNRYDATKQQFIRYEASALNANASPNRVINAIVSDEKGGLWLGTETGLQHFLPDRQNSALLQHDTNRPDSLVDSNVLSLAREPTGNLLVGTAGGLDRLHEDNGSIEHLKLEAITPSDLLGKSIRSILVAADGQAWIGTGHGLRRLAANGPLAKLLPGPAFDGVNSAAVVALYQDKAGRLWLGTGADGLELLDADRGVAQIYRHAEADGHSLASDHVSSLFEDRSGSLWIGTWYAGASRADLASGGFDRIKSIPGLANSLSNNQVVSINADSNGNLYFGTLGGLNRLDPSNGAMRVYRHDPANPHSIADDRVGLIAPEPDEPWWVATDAGLSRFDPRSGAFTASDLGTGYSDGKIIQAIARDTKGTTWFASRGGLHRQDRGSAKVTTYRHDPTDPASLCDNWIWHLLIDKRGHIWLATMNGLDRLDPETGHFTHFRNDPGNAGSLSHDRVHFLFEDSRARIWVGTAGGLDLMQTGSDGQVEFHRYTVADGLAPDPIGSIVEDDHGTLWISTTAGISRFDPGTGKFKNYTDKDGLIAGSYFIGSAFKAANGNLYFGGVNGVTSFRPDDIKENPIAPQLAITDILVLNQSVLKDKMPEGVSLKGALQDTAVLTLPHSDAVFSIEFAALHFADPKRNRYAYQLEGFDKEWVSTGAGKRFATYTNLDPGHYLFHVKASNKDGVWNDDGMSMNITITPPFWLTWWFRSLALAAVMSVAYLAYRIRVRQLLHQTTALEQEVYARTREVVQQKEAIEKQKLEAEAQKESVEQAHHNISVISDIGRQLTAKLDIEAIMDTLYRKVNELMDASVFGIGLYRAEQEIIEVPYAMERDVRYDPYVRDARDNNQMAVWCIRNKKEIFINNLEAEHRHYVDNLELTSSDTNLGKLSDGSKPTTPRAMLYVPVMLNERVLGTICVHSFEENAYRQVHLDMLRTLATYVAVAFDNAEAYKRLSLAQQRLVAQEKMAALGSLVAGVAHELNTPIGNGMLTASSLQERTNEMSAKLHDPTFRRSDLVAFVSLCQDAATLILRGLQSAADLINSFKQVAVDQTSAQRRVHNLNRTCQEIIATMSSKVRKAGHSITVDVPGDIEIDGYPGAFGQVITNFVDNALLHAFDGIRGGHMRLAAARIGSERVRVQFSDDGVGIEGANLKRIFDPFYTTKLGKGGSGLGLNISYNIVTSLLGGDISVTSVLGQGTIFVLDLPLKAPMENQ